MRRFLFQLFNTTAAISFLLCLATIASWVTGGWIDSSHRFHPIARHWEYTTDAQRGVIQLIILHHAGPPIIGPLIPTGISPVWTAWNQRFPPSVSWHAEEYGFGFVRSTIVGINPSRHATAGGTETRLMIPFGAATAIFAILPLLALRQMKNGRPPCPSGFCLTCGYDLRATPNRCPECGTTVSPPP